MGYMDYQLPRDVVDAVSDVRGIDPLELDPALEDCINTTALRQLARHDTDGWELAFEFSEHTVTVTGDGWIDVDGEHASRWDARNEEKTGP